MKAIEYYEKYKNQLFCSLSCTSPNDEKHVLSKLYLNPNYAEVFKAIFVEFADEVTTLCNARKVQTNGAVASVIKEQNQKWNALRRILKEKHPEIPEVLIENGFIEFWKDALPDYRDAGII